MNLIHDDERIIEVGPLESVQRYSPEFKAAVLADVVLLGTGATAAKYGINSKRIHDWRRTYGTANVLEDQHKHIGGLLLMYLEANLQALTAQAYVSSDPEFITRQTAGELAYLHRAMADVSIRLLEALHAGQQRAQLEDREGS